MFDREQFFTQLFRKTTGDQQLSVNQIAAIIAEAGIYQKSTVTISADELNTYPDLVALYRKLSIANYHKEKEIFNVYAIVPLSSSSFKTEYYKWLRCKEKYTATLEFIVSICRVCNMDYDYIVAAAEAFCIERLSGKGLRKILLYGVARGFLQMEEIACINAGFSCKPGLLEYYYNKAAGTHHDVSKITDGTLNFLLLANSHNSRESFLELLELESIQQGFLYDLVEPLRVVQDHLSTRGSINESVKSRFIRHHSVSLFPRYSNFCHGDIPDFDWFIKFIVAFKYNSQEIDELVSALHVNQDVYSCFKTLKQMEEEGIEDYERIGKLQAMAESYSSEKKVRSALLFCAEIVEKRMTVQ